MLSGTRWILCQNQFILWQVEQVLWNLLSISMGWCQRAESAELQISIYRKCVAFGKYESALMSIPEWANVWKNRRWLLMNSDGCYIWIRIFLLINTNLQSSQKYLSAKIYLAVVKCELTCIYCKTKLTYYCKTTAGEREVLDICKLRTRHNAWQEGGTGLDQHNHHLLSLLVHHLVDHLLPDKDNRWALLETLWSSMCREERKLSRIVESMLIL